MADKKASDDSPLRGNSTTVAHGRPEHLTRFANGTVIAGNLSRADRWLAAGDPEVARELWHERALRLLDGVGWPVSQQIVGQGIVPGTDTYWFSVGNWRGELLPQVRVLLSRRLVEQDAGQDPDELRLYVLATIDADRHERQVVSSD